MTVFYTVTVLYEAVTVLYVAQVADLTGEVRVLLDEDDPSLGCHCRML